MIKIHFESQPTSLFCSCSHHWFLLKSWLAVMLVLLASCPKSGSNVRLRPTDGFKYKSGLTHLSKLLMWKWNWTPVGLHLSVHRPEPVINFTIQTKRRETFNADSPYERFCLNTSCLCSPTANSGRTTGSLLSAAVIPPKSLATWLLLAARLLRGNRLACMCLILCVVVYWVIYLNFGQYKSFWNKSKEFNYVLVEVFHALHWCQRYQQHVSHNGADLVLLAERWYSLSYVLNVSVNRSWLCARERFINI